MNFTIPVIFCVKCILSTKIGSVDFFLMKNGAIESRCQRLEYFLLTFRIDCIHLKCEHGRLDDGLEGSLLKTIKSYVNYFLITHAHAFSNNISGACKYILAIRQHLTKTLNRHLMRQYYPNNHSSRKSSSEWRSGKS